MNRNRCSRLLELALKDINLDNYGDNNAPPHSDMPHSKIIDQAVSEEASCSSFFITTGEDLINMKKQCGQTFEDTDESSIPEPFSPDVSEYIPSELVSRSDSMPSSTSSGFRETKQSVVSASGILKEIVSNALRIVEKKTEKKIRGRKRKANSEQWKDVQRKKKKNAGEEFVNKKGKQIAERRLNSGCNDTCRQKCHQKISAERRRLLFKHFWEMGDHNLQVQYISRFVHRKPRQRILNTGTESRRQWTFKYTLALTDECVDAVCKKMFLDTFNITDAWVTTMFKKLTASGTGIIEKDMRGKHTCRANSIPEEIKQSIRHHINSVPTVESHYVRKKTSKLYFEETLNVTKLYNLYKEWIQTEQPLSPLATLRQYRELFNNEFNIEFFKPKKDQCVLCHQYKNASEQEKVNMDMKYAFHLANKTVARQLKDQDKETSKKSKDCVVACYDLQKVLTTPQSELSMFYYKRKLAVYNFTIYDMTNNQGYCYMWDETKGKKGSNEISSGLLDFIQKKVSDGVTCFKFYSDNCGGQNRNRIIALFYSYAAQKFSINITHNYFEVGHSQNEGDAMHALIERRKKHQIIYVPEQWISLVRCAKTTGNRYIVTELNLENIFNFKKLMESKTNWHITEDNTKILWNLVKHISVFGDHPEILIIQNDLINDKQYRLNLASKPITTRTRRKTGNMSAIKESLDNLDLAYPSVLGISKAKYKDLISLCRANCIPQNYHDYYNRLPVANQPLDEENE